MYAKRLSLILLLLVLSGCSISGIGSSFEASHYFGRKEYQTGISVFAEKVRQDPENAINNYYLGRFLLAENKPYRALPYLKKAASLDEEETDYQFWLGICYGAVGDEKEERQRYEKVLELSSSHEKARLYLAHLQLKDGKYTDALSSYEKVLQRYPHNAAALYNRGLCLRFMGSKEKEKEAWLEYLKWYPSGFLAVKAADHLNMMGDFSYRNHQFGYRTVTLREIRFSPGTDEIQFDSRASLKLSGAILSNFAKADMQITVFSAEKENLAKRRAIKLQSFLLKEYPKLDVKRIKLSWFAEPEILYGQNVKYLNNESVRIYLTNWQ